MIRLNLGTLVLGYIAIREFRQLGSTMSLRF